MGADTDNRALTMLKQGCGTLDIQHELGLSTNRISQLRKSLIDFDKEIQPLLDDGQDARNISLITGYHYKTIKSILKDRGIDAAYEASEHIQIYLPKSTLDKVRKICNARKQKVGTFLARKIKNAIDNIP